MNIYWRLFLLVLAILAGLIVYRWFADAGSVLSGILPSARNSPRYNLAAGLMCAIGVWGLIRLPGSGGSHQGLPSKPQEPKTTPRGTKA